MSVSRTVRAVVVGLLATVALVAVPDGAGAVGDGPPVILSPATGAKHYNGFDGPFVVDFEGAPVGQYLFYVTKVPAGGGTPVRVGALRGFAFNGSFSRPELYVDRLPVGAGYTFWVSDGAGHTATLPFAVSPGTPPTCSVVLPRTIRMKSRYARITARLSPTCTSLRRSYASWQVRSRTGDFAETFSFFSNTTDVWNLYDDELTGTYRVVPNSAKDADNEAIPQNTTSLVMKLDARLALSAKRSGRTVTLRTSLKHYVPLVNGFRVWSGRKVVLSTRSCSTCAWRPVRGARTSRAGTVTFKVRASQTRGYRVTAAGTPSTWAPVARTARR